MEMVRSINANSLESYIVMHSGHHKDMISDFKTGKLLGVTSLLHAGWSYCTQSESQTVC